MALRLVSQLVTVTLLASSLGAQGGDPVAISGVVVDQRGRAVEGAKLGTSWSFEWRSTSTFGRQRVWAADKPQAAAGWQFLEAQPGGRFAAQLLPDRRTKQLQLVVFSPDYRLGGVFLWRPGESTDGLRLALQPVARFRATLTCDDLGLRGVAANGALCAFDGSELGCFRPQAGVVDLRLPPGHYSLHLRGGGDHLVASRRFPFAVSSGEDARARDIDIPANWVAKHRGRSVPRWRATAARGVDLDRADFAAFAGKWLLVCMWNCESVEPGEDIPRLIRFDRAWRRAHPGQDPPYRILLLHSGGASTFAQLDEQIERLQLRASYWGGQALPFPILLDPDEKTRQVWQTRWRRQTLLFDPRGRLWGATLAAADLKLAVEGKLPPAVAARQKKE